MPQSTDLFIYISLLLFGFLLGAGCIWLRMRNRVKTALMHRANMDNALTSFKRKFDEMNKQRERDRFWAEEQAVAMERKRISADIHDAMGAYFAAAQNKLALIRRDTISDETFRLLQSVRNMISGASYELRHAIEQIKPLALDVNNLYQSIERFLEKNSGLRGIAFAVYQKGTPRKIEELLAISIYRIVQELVANAIKYSDCWHMNFTLNWEQNGKLVFFVRDDGQQLLGTREVGKSVTRRIALMSGQISKQPFDIKGLHLEITFQLKESSDQSTVKSVAD
jgi:signal transduction histidine kinase